MIDTQAIRSKILDLAMRGQLTEQLPEDGTTEELYQQILEEKQKLIKEGKIKKQKPLPKITDEEIPFDIPDNWKWTRFADILDVRDGTHDTPKYVTDGIPLVTSKNLKNGLIDFESAKLISYEDAKQINNRSRVDDGDILLAMIGTIGNPVLVKKDREFSIKNIALFKPTDSNLLDMSFVLCYLKNEERVMQEKARGGLQPFVSLKILRTSIIPLPPLAEQKRIVKKIDQVFSVLDTIDKLQAQYADNLTALKSKLIDAAIQGKLTKQLPEDGTAEELYQQIQEEKQRLIKEGKIKKSKPLPAITEDEIPFDIPENWKWIKLGNIANVLGGKRIPAGRTLTTENTGHKYIRISDMKNGTVNTEGLLFVPEDIYPSISQYIINKDDIYITVAGTIGKVGKIPAEIDGANLTENADRIVFSIIDQDWLIVCLSSTVVQKQIERLTTSVAQPKLAIKRIQAFSIPLPPLAEQKRIVQKLDEILKLCERMY